MSSSSSSLVQAPDAPAARTRWLLIALSSLLVLAAILRTAWLSDDAFITVRTIANWYAGHGLRWNIDERVQTSTHPLWLLVSAAGYALWRDPYVLCLLGVITSTAMVVLLLVAAPPRPRRGLWLAMILVMSKSFLSYATSGLENPLTNLLLVAFAALLLEPPPPGRARPSLVTLSLLAGLATFNRMDALVLLAPALALAAWREPSRRAALGALLAGFAPFFAWELFSLFYFGSPFPNTAHAKLSTGIPQRLLLEQGLRYLRNLALWDPLTLAALVLGLGQALWAGDGRRRALALGGLLYLGYVVRIGGDFMAGRFFVAPLVLALALLAHAPRVPPAEQRWPLRSLSPVLAALPLVGLLSAGPLSHPAWLRGGQRLVYAGYGVADERIFYYPTTGWLIARPSPRDSYLPRFGIDLREAGKRVVVEPCIGQVGYYAGETVHIVDSYGLGDPLLARLPVRDPRRWRVGHFERAVPAGYEATLATGRNLIASPPLHRYYDQLSLILRAPLWSRQRLAAIVRLNLGQLDPLLKEHLARR